MAERRRREWKKAERWVTSADSGVLICYSAPVSLCIVYDPTCSHVMDEHAVRKQNASALNTKNIPLGKRSLGDVISRKPKPDASQPFTRLENILCERAVGSIVLDALSISTSAKFSIRPAQ